LQDYAIGNTSDLSGYLNHAHW